MTRERMTVGVMGKFHTDNWPTIHFDIEAIDTDQPFQLEDVGAIVAKKLPVSTCRFPDSSYTQKYPYMKDIEFPK